MLALVLQPAFRRLPYQHINSQSVRQMVIYGARDTGPIPAMDISGYRAFGSFRLSQVFYGLLRIGNIPVAIMGSTMGIGDLMSDFMVV